ncbi:MAG: glycogen synthase GlgA [Bauldia sp.]
MSLSVLSVASEVYPLIKTGGLADVVGALPAALKPHDVEVQTLVPGYPRVLGALTDRRQLHAFEDFFGGTARLVAGKGEGIDILALDAPHLYDRPGNPYVGLDGKDWPDNAERFAALSFVAAEIGRGTVPGLAPSVIHAHDWQTGLVPAYLHYGGVSGARPRTVITIHNIAFQGQFAAAAFPKLRLPQAAFSLDGVEYYGGVGFLKAGLHFADAITTVSPSYAVEIKTVEGGMGLDGLIRSRSDRLTGIVNGIDTDVWNPATDSYLGANFSSRTLVRRAANKAAIEERFGLEQSDGPLFCLVSRLTLQKGVDLIINALPNLLARGARFAILGSGDAPLEAALKTAAKSNPGKVGVVLGYDEVLAHMLQGGADAILVPSRFEPCGLTQLYGLRYGCVPVVSRVGGLADTLIDANDAAIAAKVATGIQFHANSVAALEDAVARAMALFREPAVWSQIQRRGMAADNSWHRPAGAYAALFRSLVAEG